MSNIYKKLAGQTAIYGLSSIIGRLLNYLLVPLYTRIFVPEVYGVVVELYAYVGFLLIILTYGMETGFFRFAQIKDDFERVYSTIITSLISSSIFFVILVYLFLGPISGVMQYGGNPEYILWMAVIVAIDAIIAIPFAKLRLKEKALKFAVIKIINISVNIGSNLFFLVLCPRIAAENPESSILIIYSAEIGVGYVFVSNLIANIVTLILLLPEIFNVRFSFDKRLLRQILLYSIPLLVAGLAGMINETLDRILLKYLLPDDVNAMEQIGIYGANYKLAILMTLFIQMFRYAAEPFFFGHHKEKNSVETYANVTKYFIVFGLCIFLGVMLYIDILKYFISEKYHSGLSVVPILLSANLFLGILYNLAIWYKLKDLTKYGALIAIIGALITVILNMILIPYIGYMGSAWATFICYLSMVIISYFWGRNHLKVPYDLKKIAVYFLVTGIFFAISLIIEFNSIYVSLAVNTNLMIAFIFFVLYYEGIYKKIPFINKLLKW